MKVIVGLGNPGEKYAKNRHNVGFGVIDELLAVGSRQSTVKMESKFEALICKVGDTLLVKPQTFMNRSGKAVSQIVNFYKVDLANLYVIHDDLDIKLGEFKIVNGIGPKVHNGVNSIEESLGQKDFWRIRIGVDNRSIGDERPPGEEYVLGDFLEDEKELLFQVGTKIIKELQEVLI